MRSSSVRLHTDFVLLLWLVVVLIMLELRCWVFKRYAQDRKGFLIGDAIGGPSVSG